MDFPPRAAENTSLEDDSVNAAALALSLLFSGAPGGWWSLRPIERPAIPELDAAGRAWARTPVDAFIFARLRAGGLVPSPEADRRTLIRRLTLDLTGLLPSPEETAAFLSDRAPDAHERLADRLLASPRHGERWARHWMDAVHFAETHGHDQDRVRPNAWPYRDYLIQAFNEDKPYARFIEEQIAADVLFPGEPRLAVALGLLAAGPWDESSLRDIREDSIDRQIGFYLDRDDMVSTVCSTFLSTTVHCARCHDHKFDPVTQDDYYALQAVFAGVGRADRAYDADARVAAERARLRGEIARLERRDPDALAALDGPGVAAEVEDWIRRAGREAAAWTVLAPASFASSEGTALEALDDQSVLASGPRPEKDTYTVAVEAPRETITAVRVEVLADPGLPHGGPGRQDNGNLHLSELRVLASGPPAAGAAPGGGSPGQTVALANPTADFDQEGWTAAHALDGDAATAWGIHPEVGRSHQAVFELKEDLILAPGGRLTFVLEQLHGRGHLIGRFRLSAATSPRPVRVTRLPDAVARALATPPAARSREDCRELARHYVLEKLTRALAALPPERFVYAAASDFAPDGGHKPPGGPRPVHVLRRGDIHQPERIALPGALSCVAALPPRFDIPDPGDEAARRAALARWISSPRNPLTWRSIANRIWHHHFGRGIVETPGDLGRMGAEPTHPELLDWLAAELLESGGSLKRLHRLIVTSAVYRQSSAEDAAGAARDAANRLLWRQNRARLDAEELRDAVLQVSGRLDLAMGGPSVEHFAISPGVHVTPVVDYTKFDWDAPGAGRRSIYRFIFRTLPDPFMDAFDCADASQLTAARAESVSAQQALSMLNGAFILHHAARFAERLRAQAPDTGARIALACALALGRAPEAEEAADMAAYAERHGLENLCRFLLNSNEFLHVD
jgi:hypothetical protein